MSRRKGPTDFDWVTMRRSAERQDQPRSRRFDGTLYSRSHVTTVQLWGLIILGTGLIMSGVLALVFGLSKLPLIHGAMDKAVFAL